MDEWSAFAVRSDWRFYRLGQTKADEASSNDQPASTRNGLASAAGTVRYPAEAAPGRSSVRRMWENRRYGMKEGYMETGQPR